MAAGGEFGLHMVGTYVGLLFDDFERFLSAHMFDAQAKEWVDTKASGFDVMPDLPRKASC
jgi:hypothetical protein